MTTASPGTRTLRPLTAVRPTAARRTGPTRLRHVAQALRLQMQLCPKPDLSQLAREPDVRAAAQAAFDAPPRAGHHRLLRDRGGAARDRHRRGPGRPSPHRPPQLPGGGLQAHRGEVAQPVPDRELPAVLRQAVLAQVRQRPGVGGGAGLLPLRRGSACQCAGSSGAGLRSAASVRPSRPSAPRARAARHRAGCSTTPPGSPPAFPPPAASPPRRLSRAGNLPGADRARQPWASGPHHSRTTPLRSRTRRDCAEAHRQGHQLRSARPPTAEHPGGCGEQFNSLPKEMP